MLFSVDAFILKKSPLGENDAVVSLFTRQLGHIRSITKGRKKPLQSFSNLNEPFTFIHAQVFQKTLSSSFRLDHIDSSRHYSSIRSSLEKIQHGYLLLEILDRFTPDSEPNESLFALTESTLDCLETYHEDFAKWILLQFTLQFFEISGFRFNLDTCIECGRSRCGKAACFLPAEGSVICRSCRESRGIDTLTLSRQALSLINQVRTSKRWLEEPDQKNRQKLTDELYPLIVQSFIAHFNDAPKSFRMIGTNTVSSEKTTN